MKPTGTVCVLLAILGLALSGCSKSAASLGSSNDKLFQSADATTKAAWDTATAAIKTNGYATAILALKKLQVQTSLTAEQLKAVNETVTAVSDQMYEAANKGDAAAKQSLEDLRKAMGR